MTKVIAIAGAGPAGLTAALELLKRAEAVPLVFDLDSQVGGISKTVNYRGNRMDLGGHRFFSKSDWVMNWWQEILPVSMPDAAAGPISLGYQNQTRDFVASDSAASGDGRVMLVRPRLSRIYYRRKYFDYPLRLNLNTLSSLGWTEAARLGLSYLSAQASPRRPEVTLEDFFINRFGDRLYRTFFKDYTEKVWGVACAEISAEWGAQRIKGLSITTALKHAIGAALGGKSDVSQKSTETSLIERFLYPRHGPGQMWEEVARRVVEAGGQIRLRHAVVGIEHDEGRVRRVAVQDLNDGGKSWVDCDALISTMPVQQLVGQLSPSNEELLRIARGLPYRDFMTAGLVVRRMQGETPQDNWIYIQEPDVKLGRLQIFNNWSPDLVADPATVSLGLEYFCREGDELWSMADGSFLEFAARELESIGLIHREDVVDGTVVRVAKAYPAYFGEYRHMGRIREFLDGFDNLYPVGRNGMHRYNNQDHSMLAARAAVQCIVGESSSKEAIWAINTEEDYHEESSRGSGTGR
jgi:protoporphyrinogen oxidase